MNAILRSLIVWLALLALPFQGFASATMLPHAPQAAQPAACAAHHAHHQMAAASHEHHCDGGDHAGKCSHCADCCAGVAIAPLPVTLPAPDTNGTFVARFEAGHVPSVDPDHPERPPRFARA